ncbi:NUDIX domain-containing protein [Candidatus Pacearchaeota archaeon]|nr:NUDIX domain-containing protein [Candidatus Pacearchaeota archaeon]
MIKAISGVVIRDEKILLVRKNDIWILPGGKPHEKESDIECLCREFGEELSGLKIEDIRYYDCFEGRTPCTKDMLKVETYFCEISEGIGKPSQEISGVEWVKNFSDYNISNVTKKVINSLKENKYL